MYQVKQPVLLFKQSLLPPLMIVQLLANNPVLLVTILRVVIVTWLTRVTRVSRILQLQLATLDVYSRLTARFTLDDLVHCTRTTEVSTMRTTTEDGVTSSIHVQHVVKLVKVGVLRHLPLGVCVWDVDPAPLHLGVEGLLVVAGRALERRLARLQGGLLDTVPVVSPPAARRDQTTWPGSGSVSAGVKTDHTHPVLGEVAGLGLPGPVLVTEAVHLAEEDEEVLSRLRESSAGEVVGLLAGLSKVGGVNTMKPVLCTESVERLKL